MQITYRPNAKFPWKLQRGTETIRLTRQDMLQAAAAFDAVEQEDFLEWWNAETR